MIQVMELTHIPEVISIYAQGIALGYATFETKVPTVEQFDAKYHPTLRFVAVEDEKVRGWISITPYSAREVYQGAAELSVYVAPEAKGKGIGLALMQQLEQEAKKQNYWLLQGSIIASNTASIALHKKAGYRQVGTRIGIAKRDGQWLNTVLMEKHLVLEEAHYDNNRMFNSTRIE